MPDFLRTGTLLYATGMLLLAAMDAFVKLIATDLAVGQLWLFRACVAFLPVFLFIRYVDRYSFVTALQTRHLGLQVLRFLTIVFALRVSELAAVAMFGLTAPVIMIALGFLLLKERIDLERSALCGLSFFAALSIVPLSSDIGIIGATWACLSALCHAFATVLGRILTRTDAPSTLALYTNIVAILCAVVTVMLNPWTIMPAIDILYCTMVGFLGGSSYICLAAAIKHIEVKQASILEYTVYIWAALFGFVFFSELPSIVQITAAIMIILCTVASSKLE